MTLQELKNDGGQDQTAEQHGRGQRDPALQAAVDPGDDAIGVLDLLQDAPAVQEIALAGAGQLDGAGGRPPMTTLSLSRFS